MEGDNLLQILGRRERNYYPSCGEHFENLLERDFLSNNREQKLALENNVISTIAIAFSHDGSMVATTHGDHTVKIFMYASSKLYKTFHGHPRTPWTVKFHPHNRSYVASGCLGFEVRVWHIESTQCINVHRYEHSIISVAFHPSGDFLGVASGPQLHFWNWRRDTEDRIPFIGEKFHIVHDRNIRAVLFHPSGNFLLAAAPKSPAQKRHPLTFCRLHILVWNDSVVDTLIAAAMSSAENSTDSYHSTPVRLDDLPVLIPR